MTKINVKTVEGAESDFNANDGISLMENLRDNGYDDIIALCGGIMACATCHVYVDKEWMEKVGQPSSEEVEILEGSGFKKENSRLSCQIKVDQGLDGLRVEIAPA